MYSECMLTVFCVVSLIGQTASTFLRSELEDIASKPSKRYVYSVEQFEQIKTIREVLLKDVCEAVGEQKTAVKCGYAKRFCNFIRCLTAQASFVHHPSRFNVPDICAKQVCEQC